MSVPEDKKSDHLFLLMGENPLPNYVAAMLLTRTDSSTIYLLHSEGEQRKEKTVLSTKQFAEFLQAVIKAEKPLVKVVLHGISEVDSKEIENKVRDIVQHYKIAGRVGFNYTGARKPMAIHTYKVLEERVDNVVFSYLDANRLEMRFDGISTPYPVAHELQVKLKTLAALHAYEIENIDQTPKSMKLASILQDTLQNKPEIKAWKKWIYKTGCSVLPDRQEYPALATTRDALDKMCGGAATPELVAQELGFDEFKSCTHWFSGGWLEELALEAILNNKKQNQVQIHDYGISLKPKPSKSLGLENRKNFELDAAAMIGYQLFAVSCIASKKEGGETKKHLFEAYVRARQLGGDEARVALVSLVEDPSVLQDEIGRDWHPSHQIKVFGRDDLMNLTNAFYDWFTNAN